MSLLFGVLLVGLVPVSYTHLDVYKRQVQGHVEGILDRMCAGGTVGPGGTAWGTTDFAKDVSADLPLLTLADVMGVPAQDRWLMFDWANRVIGWQEPDYLSLIHI